MNYIPTTSEDQETLLKTIGVKTADDLCAVVPKALRYPKLDLPEALSEAEAIKLCQSLAAECSRPGSYLSFLGAGAYEHFIPSTVNYLASRGEFSTCYTPYQAEASQGTLQAIFEYQTLIADLTGMPIANASLYDGASACAEAVLCAVKTTDRTKVLVAGSLHPEYRAVIRTYCAGSDVEIVEIPWAEDGTCDQDALAQELGDETACVLAATPNFFGSIEHMDTLAAKTHEAGALFVAQVEPVSLALLRAPGDYGADIVVGEAQSLGNALNFGGPYAGFFACTKKLMRKMPGRLVGRTVDHTGKTGYTLTIQTREQHIRRHRATSNICSNESLCVLQSAIYMCALGKEGMKDLAYQNMAKCHYAVSALTALKGVRAAFTGAYFNECVIVFDGAKNVGDILAGLRKKKIIGGLDLSGIYPALRNSLLLCVTETKTREEIDRLVKAIDKIL